MKKVLCLLILVIALGCKAQTPILPRYGNLEFAETHNAYYKDIDNFQQQFIGTWKYTNGATLLTVQFKQIPMSYEESGGGLHYYEDYLVGEYKYIENGIEKVNTLPALSLNNQNPFKYNLQSSARINKDAYPKCPECGTDDKRLIFTFYEPTRDRFNGPQANFIVRVVQENGVAKIIAEFINTSQAYEAATEELKRFSLPYGKYVLIKQ